ncbi:MAG: hypothetical protein H6668_13205 [Ardenticatenaceae bacterium]|nr:hypothetical protein [Ardenticatenaceae bacterium]
MWKWQFSPEQVERFVSNWFEGCAGHGEEMLVTGETGASGNSGPHERATVAGVALFGLSGNAFIFRRGG